MIAHVTQHSHDQCMATHRGGQRLGHRPDLGATLQRVRAQGSDLLLGEFDPAAQFGVLGSQAVDLGGSNCAKIGRG